jgi:DNA-binding XRE family transcriptional regulator
MVTATSKRPYTFQRRRRPQGFPCGIASHTHLTRGDRERCSREQEAAGVPEVPKRRGRERTSDTPLPPRSAAVRQLRLLHGLTQRELASLLGISVHTLSALERGRYEATEPLLRLARALMARREHEKRPERVDFYGILSENVR